MSIEALTTRADDAAADDGASAAPATAEVLVTRRPLRRGPSGLLMASIALLTLGAAFVVASTVAPDAVEKVSGDIKVSVQKQFQQVFAPDALPQLRLGGEGGLAQLDECDGTFTEMISYRVEGVLPLFAAHNNCGGDIILGWELGQRVTVEGSDVVYEVIEERHTPKWSDVDALVGMSGEFMVQTCFYGENRMRFLALAQVDSQQ